ncbi:hypothetical protein [Emticicia sp. C21]|uniref:hypothetical protein n=1 Tax=Emticicia sp. C21 TaxID=2302915 RepID=UPI000E3496E2|nr:hypothetical protein [Emticicia sp. C21]RFS14027.1 hypothetical protein D0T08_23885 [Emticicia sp. C21]
MGKPDFQQALKDNDKPASSSKVLLLLAINLIGIGIIFILPKNVSFIQFKIQSFYNTKARLGNDLDSAARYNLIYAKECAIINLLDSVMKEDDIFLLPPQYYLVENAYNPKNHIDPYTWTYPSKFKNLAMNKVRFVEITYPDSLLQKATHTFLATRKKGFQLVNLNDSSVAQKEAIIKKLKVYQPFGFFIPQTAVDYLKQKNKKPWKP